MKAKALEPFGDHKEGVIRQADDVFELTKERFAELENKLPSGFIEEVKSKKTTKEVEG